MSKKLVISCGYCDSLDNFLDFVELKQKGWLIVAWIVQENKPLVRCPKCNQKYEKLK